MFLDEELLQTGRNTDVSDFDDVQESINFMIQACFNNLTNNLAGHLTDDAILASFKRVNNTFAKVAEKLELEGRGFVKKDGFEIICLSKPELKTIFEKLEV